ncbi:C-factor, partial [Corvus brachyrhynchos]
SNMGELCVHSVLVTGANRGLGLGFVQHFLRMPKPPQWIFATCRDPKGQRAQELQNLASKHPNIIIIPLRCLLEVGILCPSSSVLPTVEGAAPLPCAMSMCAPVPSVSSQAFLPLLKKAAQGSPGSGLSCSKAAIINMSSYAGSIEDVYLWDFGQVVSYRCSKAALKMLSKCQSLAYREHGVLCVALHPGWVQTDMGDTGSYKPPLTVDDSLQGMLKVLSSLSEKETGTFLDWEGKVLPW